FLKRGISKLFEEPENCLVTFGQIALDVPLRLHRLPWTNQGMMLFHLDVRGIIIHRLPVARSEPRNIHQHRNFLTLAAGSQSRHWDANLRGTRARNDDMAAFNTHFLKRRVQNSARKHQTHLSINVFATLNQHWHGPDDPIFEGW